MNQNHGVHHLRDDDAVFSAGAEAADDSAALDYVAYADGKAGQPFRVDGAMGYTDREVWRRIDVKLAALASSGCRSLTILDAGCGPGTWLRRIALRARELGFAALELRGLDISPKMVALAQDAVTIDGICLDVRVDVADLGAPLHYASGNFDISLCLYGALNHLPATAQSSLAANLARVTRDTMFVTVRTAGSMPTIYIDDVHNARSFRQDNAAGWMEVNMRDGRHLAFPSYLFTCDKLRSLFEPHLASVSFTGLDLFHSRFAADPHWNPSAMKGQAEFDEHVDWLEQHFASDPSFIDHATHILLVGECKPARQCKVAAVPGPQDALPQFVRFDACSS